MEPNVDQPITKADLGAEVSAMQTVAQAIEGLGADAALRVLNWALSAVSGTTTAVGGTDKAPSGPRPPVDPETGDLADLFFAVNPSTEKDKALVAAYWLHQLGGQDFTGHQANSLLRELGHGVANITREFDRLMAMKPQLVIQTRKTGQSKQGRKQYRLTTAGQNHVRRLLDNVQDQ